MSSRINSPTAGALRSRFMAAMLLVGALSLTACHCLPCTAAAKPSIQSQLYFGFQKPDKSYVTDEQWQKFVDDHITPRFPAGLTVLHGDGQYRGENGVIVHEPSRIVVVLYPTADARETDKKLREIAVEYANEFQQESVMRVDGLSQTSFISK